MTPVLVCPVQRQQFFILTPQQVFGVYFCAQPLHMNELSLHGFMFFHLYFIDCSISRWLPSDSSQLLQLCRCCRCLRTCMHFSAERAPRSTWVLPLAHDAGPVSLLAFHHHPLSCYLKCLLLVGDSLGHPT